MSGPGATALAYLVVLRDGTVLQPASCAQELTISGRTVSGTFRCADVAIPEGEVSLAGEFSVQA